MGKNIKIITIVIFVVIVIGGVYSLGKYNGKSSSQSLAEQKLGDLQQSISEQSEKIDNLQKEKAGSKNSPASIDAQAIIQSSKEKTNRDEQVKCQQELGEYNSCLAEYNSKMAEYNSCLTESADPNSWRYKTYCSKPSNYCFKPVCAY